MTPPSKSRAIACRTVPFRDFLAPALALFLVTACGGSASVAADSSPEAGTAHDAGGVAPLDCSTAFEGAPCDHEGAICRGACAVCATCGFLGCSGGRWSSGSDFPPSSCFEDASTDAHDAAGGDAEAHDAGVSPSTIPCGPLPDGGLRECNFPLEYCEESGGGPPPPPDAGPYVSYACAKVPAACASAPTCACLLGSGKSALCGGSGIGAAVACTPPDGGPTVECAYP